MSFFRIIAVQSKQNNSAFAAKKKRGFLRLKRRKSSKIKSLKNFVSIKYKKIEPKIFDTGDFCLKRSILVRRKKVRGIYTVFSNSEINFQLIQFLKNNDLLNKNKEAGSILEIDGKRFKFPQILWFFDESFTSKKSDLGYDEEKVNNNNTVEVLTDTKLMKKKKTIGQIVKFGKPFKKGGYSKIFYTNSSNLVVKVIQIAFKDPELGFKIQDTLNREAKVQYVLSKLSNIIVKPFAVGIKLDEKSVNIYLIMERMELNLAEFFKRQSIKDLKRDLPEVIRKGLEICAFLEKQKKIDMDLKAENLLINPKELLIKLCDFGGVYSVEDVIREFERASKDSGAGIPKLQFTCGGLDNMYSKIIAPEFKRYLCGDETLNLKTLNSKMNVYLFGKALSDLLKEKIAAEHPKENLKEKLPICNSKAVELRSKTNGLDDVEKYFGREVSMLLALMKRKEHVNKCVEGIRSILTEHSLGELIEINVDIISKLIIINDSDYNSAINEIIGDVVKQVKDFCDKKAIVIESKLKVKLFEDYMRKTVLIQRGSAQALLTKFFSSK